MGRNPRPPHRQRALRVAHDSPTRLLRSAQPSRCRDCGNRIDEGGRGVRQRHRRQGPRPAAPGRPEDDPPRPGRCRRPRTARAARCPPGPAAEQQPDPEITLDLPGLLADHLADVGDETIRAALASGRTICRGQGHSLRITAALELHRTALQQAATLAAETAGPAERKARRVYAARIAAAE
ncbi:DUF6083 domain-containing protein [Streptomyces sp. NBC_01718]|uniref:DUF6083 domain-containing protein n=1 Tax=Streptomyces sp. NBC_01718 TaxID=2975919 RepID=UPI00352FC327